MRTFVDMRYRDKDGCYEWEDIADKLSITVIRYWVNVTFLVIKQQKDSEGYKGIYIEVV
jgi:hypothetical protein